MENMPIELHLHTIDSLLKELISGRAVLVNQTDEFKILSERSRTVLNWYKENPDKWSKPNREDDVKLIAAVYAKKPPNFAPIQHIGSIKKSLKYHLKKIEINQFGGINKFSDASNQNDVLEFELQKPITLFQGHNGAGKTSLMSAISWCLSGFVYRSQNFPQKLLDSIDLSIKNNGIDIIKKASIITPIPPSSYIQSLSDDKIPLNTWVKLSFMDDEGNDVGFVKRTLNWRSSRGSNIIEKIDGLDVLGLDPISLEIGTKIPGLIPYIQLDLTSDLGKAIAELTGLRSILDLVKHAIKSKEKLTGILTDKIIEEIKKINEEFNQKREELLNHFTTYPDISPKEDVPLSNDKDLITKLDKHITKFEKLLSESLVKVKEILGENFNPENPNDRDDLVKNISIGIDSLGVHSIKELESAKKLGIVKNLSSDVNNIELKIQSILTEAEEIDTLAAKPGEKSRQQLYARISNWISQNSHDKTICPVCMESLKGKIDPVTKRGISEHIQEHLKNPKEFLSYSINQWGIAHINEIRSEYKTINELSELPDSPQGLIRKIFIEELFTKPCFQLSLAPLKEKTRLLTDEAIKILPLYVAPAICKLPKSIMENCDSLGTFLNHLQKIVAFAKWRSTVEEECKNVFQRILGKRNKLPDQVAEYTLKEWLDTLQMIINNSSPIRAALKKINELRDKINIDRKKQEDLLLQYKEASDALENVIKLGDHVNNEVKSLMQELSGKAKEWKKKLYNPAYTDHPKFTDSEISASGALQIQAEIHGTRIAAQHVSNSSDLRSTLLAVYFALWEYLYRKRGGISLLMLDDLHELFDERNYHNYIDSLPDISSVGAKVIIAANNNSFSRLMKTIPDPNHIDHKCIHPLSKNRQHIELGLFIEKIEEKRKLFEEKLNDDGAAQDYMNASRIYLEQQLGDLLCDTPIKNQSPTLFDYVGELRTLCNRRIEPFHEDVFNKVVSHPVFSNQNNPFMKIMNKCHHGKECEIAYNDVNDDIQKQSKEVLSLIFNASKSFYLWLLRKKIIRSQKPTKPLSLKIIQSDIPLYENIAAASSDVSGEGDSTFEKLSHDILDEYAIYYLKTNNFGFSACIGNKAIVKLADEPIKPNSLVIALYKDKVLARRYSEMMNGNEIILSSEMLDFKRRPPSLVLPAEEVRLLEVIGFLFDGKMYGKDKINDEAILLENYKLSEQITMAFRVRGESAVPLALDGQVILGGPQIFAKNFDTNIGKLIALATNENEQVFKRIGKSIKTNKFSHLRIFDTIGGLGESKTYRTDDLEDDPFGKIPVIIPNSVREIVGVLYISA